MRKISGLNPITATASLCGALLALSACRQDSPASADSAPAGEYAVQVQKIKAGPSELIESGLQALDAKFGFGTPSPEIANTAGGTGPLPKAAATVFTATGKCTRLKKLIFSALSGDNITFRATSYSPDGSSLSDPVVMLIQFDDPDFIANGTIPNTPQARYRILEWNDDISSGDLSASIFHSFATHEGGYFMVMAFPYNNANSTRFAKMSFEQKKINCPSCDAFWFGTEMLGGLVYRSQGANDFITRSQTSGVGNPHTYINMRSLGSGMSNGDWRTGIQDSEVYPYPISAADGAKTGNVILIDNDATGSATFIHSQNSL
jgi:hypothetical protein